MERWPRVYTAVESAVRYASQRRSFRAAEPSRRRIHAKARRKACSAKLRSTRTWIAHSFQTRIGDPAIARYACLELAKSGSC
jgi:hypothetical protein